MAQELYWIWLAEQCGAGSCVPAYLCRKGLTAKDVYDGALDNLTEENEVLTGARAALKSRDLGEAERILDKCASVGIAVLTPESPQYPLKLRGIADLPGVLYVRGTLPNMTKRLLTTVVGTRSMSDYGRRTAFALGSGLAYGGSILVSGMALGADSMAIIGAIEAKGTVIAVLGSGVDVIYPREHADLYRKIIASGAVISEFKPGTAPAGGNFPIRNRIMSGLSDATVVVEAGEGSGALITARTAVEQGRTLFAVPGRVGDEGSFGTNQLICDGAIPATTAEDVLGEFEFMYQKTVSVDRAHTMLHGRDMEEASKTAMMRERVSTPANRGQSYGKGSYGGKYKSVKRESNWPDKPAAEVSGKKAEATPAPIQKKKTDGKLTDRVGIASAAKSIIDAVFPTKKEANPSENMKTAEKSEEKVVPAKKIELDMLDEKEIKVYNRMKPSVPVMPDSLVDESMEIGDVLAALTILEIAGAVESGGGGYYMRIQPDDIMQSPND